MKLAMGHHLVLEVIVTRVLVGSFFSWSFFITWCSAANDWDHPTVSPWHLWFNRPESSYSWYGRAWRPLLAPAPSKAFDLPRCHHLGGSSIPELAWRLLALQARFDYQRCSQTLAISCRKSFRKKNRLGGFNPTILVAKNQLLLQIVIPCCCHPPFSRPSIFQVGFTR